MWLQILSCAFRLYLINIFMPRTKFESWFIDKLLMSYYGSSQYLCVKSHSCEVTTLKKVAIQLHGKEIRLYTVSRYDAVIYLFNHIHTTKVLLPHAFSLFRYKYDIYNLYINSVSFNHFIFQLWMTIQTLSKNKESYYYQI